MSYSSHAFSSSPFSTSYSEGCVPPTTIEATITASSDGFYWGEFPDGDAPGCDAFEFDDVDTVPVDIEITSNEIPIANLTNGASKVKAWVSGGKWAKQVGGSGAFSAFSDEPGDVAEGDVVVLDLTSINGTITAVFNAGTQSDSWSVVAP